MSGMGSRLRRQQAVEAARKMVYRGIQPSLEYFDERMKTIYTKHVAMFTSQKAIYEELDNDLWIVYTGLTRKEYMEKEND